MTLGEVLGRSEGSCPRCAARDKMAPPGTVTGAARRLLGQRVVVTVQREKLEQFAAGPVAEIPVEFTGVLHAVTEDGEVTLMQDDGTRAYCWPLLEIREVSR